MMLSGQPYIAQLYGPLNTFHIILEVAAAISAGCFRSHATLCARRAGKLIPISQFAKLVPTPGTISVNHQGQFPSVTLSFIFAGVSLGQAVSAIQQAEKELGMPPTLQTSFQGTPGVFKFADDPSRSSSRRPFRRLYRARRSL